MPPKTVIGSDNLPSLIQGLIPEVRKKLERCKCQVTFRFGNHGTLQSQHALIVPFQGFKLKIAVVPGSTPFLLSNTLLRAIEAVIDTRKQSLWSEKLKKEIPLHITNRGLFLLDLNDLVQPIDPTAKRTSEPAETHLSIELSKTMNSTKAEKGKVQDNCIENMADQSEFPVKESTLECSDCEINDKIEMDNLKEQTCKGESCSIKKDTVGPDGSKSFASSFQVPSRGDHGQPCSSIEESSDSRRRTAARFFSHVDSPVGGEQDRLRDKACWRQLPPRLDPRPSMGHVDDSALRQFQEDQPSSIPALCRDEDRTCRARGHDSAGDTPLEPTLTLQSQKGRGKSSMPKAKAKSQATVPLIHKSGILEELEDFDEETFEMLNPLETEKDAEIQVLQSRMLNIENALQQVICHLEAQKQSQEQ